MLRLEKEAEELENAAMEAAVNENENDGQKKSAE